MRTIGVFLIFATVVLRGMVISIDQPYTNLVFGLLVVFGLFLFAKSWFMRHKRLLQSRVAQLIYLLVQFILAIGLLMITAYGDVFALLFIPLSLDAVTFYGRRVGYFCIALFSVAFTTVLLSSEEGQVFGLTMGVFFSGMCFLFGGYSNLVSNAEAARDRNRQAYAALQIVHQQLQGYAGQVTILAMEHERSRLARDLHDSVTQTVFSMNLTAQSARLLLDKEPQRCSGQLLHLEELAANALSEIQSLILQLKPRSFTEGGLPAAIRLLASERKSRDGMRITFDCHGEENNLSETEILGLYIIVNEALSNVLKHSGMSEANIRLNLNDDQPCLEITDHGCGFDLLAVSEQPGHLGLTGMSERAKEMGWRLVVESYPQQGTHILVTRDRVEGTQ